jgi:hypothetical protein
MNPSAMLFAREVSPELTRLLKQLDAAVAAHADRRLCGCVIFCNDDPGLAGRLQSLAQAEHLGHLVLATYHSDGPPHYKIAREADVTVLLYHRVAVKFNCAFRKGELTDPASKAILAWVEQVVPKD